VKGRLIGVDIGSSAVRAAEVSCHDHVRTLHRFGQVGLPVGAVVDGEVTDVPCVVAALRRLWDAVGFQSKRVVLGASSQRVIVRQADVAAMSAADFRLALRFEAQELIPFSLDQALVDFSIIEPDIADGSPNPKMRILVAAAHRETVAGHLRAARDAGLHVVAVDPTPLALFRGLDAGPGPANYDAVVAVGSDLTSVAIGHQGLPKFTRILGVGGSVVTQSLGRRLELGAAEAENMKRRAVQQGADVRGGDVLLVSDFSEIVEEIRGTVDFFRAQDASNTLGRVYLTGGGAQIPGFSGALSRELRLPVEWADPVANLRLDEVGLDDPAMQQARQVMLAPIGLALWATEPANRRMTLLPPEIAAARRQRRIVATTAAGLGAFAVVLGAFGVSKAEQVRHVRHEVAVTTQTNAALQDQLVRLSGVDRVRTEVASERAAATQALNHDINWGKLLDSVTAAIPPGQWMSTLTLTATANQPQTSSSAAAKTGPPTDGRVTFAMNSVGGQDSSAQWLRAMANVPGLTNLWVPSSTQSATTPTAGAKTSGFTVIFNATADITPAAESHRAQQLPGGTP
jgi:type IV pilus assembly protein PilM